MTKIYVFDQDQQIFSQNLLRKQVLKIIPKILSHYPIGYSIYSSVSGFERKLIKIMTNRTRLMIFNYQTPIPIKNLYQTPSTLGSDRLAAAIGANFLFPDQNLVIFDIGTAITIDVVTKTGEYLGGNISPGPRLRFLALNKFTSNLPLLDLKEPAQLLGKTTEQAIVNGVVYGIVNEIESYIKKLNESFENLRPILTGGYANFFEKKMKSPIFVQINLVPIGLNRVIEYNKQAGLI